jgi:hypothetical protein
MTQATFSYYRNLVEDFMLTFKQPINVPNDNNVRYARLMFLSSEHDELKIAERQYNLLDYIDANIDIMYIGFGGFVELNKFKLYPVGAGYIDISFKAILDIDEADRIHQIYTQTAYATLQDELGLIPPQIDDLFKIVHRANMRKLWTPEEVKYRMPSYFTATLTKIGDDGKDMIIVKDNFGKVRKPPGWVGPDKEMLEYLEAIPDFTGLCTNTLTTTNL